MKTAIYHTVFLQHNNTYSIARTLFFTFNKTSFIINRLSTEGINHELATHLSKY